MRSLRARAVAGSVIWASIVSVLGFFFLGSYLEQQTQSRFDDLLIARHDRAIVALANSTGNPDQIARQLSAAVYQSPFSGNYWQIERQDEGTLLVSRSLADALLPRISETGSDLRLSTVKGPAGQMLKMTTQMISLGDGSNWVVQVASSTAPLLRDKYVLRQRLSYAAAIIAALAIIGAFGLVIFALRPLAQLRKDVVSRWNSVGDLPTSDYPLEVKPLVTDINELLARNRDIVGRSRRQAADLAHALKTPSAILRNELEALHQHGLEVANSLDALDRLDAQLARSFARMRAVQGSSAENLTTDIDLSLGRMSRAFSAMAKNKGREMATTIAPNLKARIHQSDLEEIVGNLLDNALKWSTTTIEMRAVAEEETIRISVEDDGPGIRPEDRMRIISSGQRLDESKPGTGLGLAIAHELVRAYDGTMMVLDPAELCGARFEIVLPRLPIRQEYSSRF